MEVSLFDAFPREIVAEIFTFLTVEELTRLESVSTRWRRDSWLAQKCLNLSEITDTSLVLSALAKIDPSKIGLLQLRSHGVDGQLGSKLQELKNVKFLDISAGKFEQETFQVLIDSMPELRVLWMSTTSIKPGVDSDSGLFPWLDNIAQLKHLVALDLTNFEISDDALQRFCKSCHSPLMILHLAQNSRLTSEGIAHLEKYSKTLVRLDLSGTSVNDYIWSTFANLTKLHSLLISSCRGLSSSPLARLTVVEMKSLVGIDISNCAFPDDDFVKTLSNLPLLGHLNVANCSYVSRQAIQDFKTAKSHAILFCESWKAKARN